MRIEIELRLHNSLFNANDDAPEVVHRQSHMKNPRAMKNGARIAARTYNRDQGRYKHVRTMSNR